MFVPLLVLLAVTVLTYVPVRLAGRRIPAVTGAALLVAQARQVSLKRPPDAAAARSSCSAVIGRPVR